VNFFPLAIFLWAEFPYLGWMTPMAGTFQQIFLLIAGLPNSCG